MNVFTSNSTLAKEKRFTQWWRSTSL